MFQAAFGREDNVADTLANRSVFHNKDADREGWVIAQTKARLRDRQCRSATSGTFYQNPRGTQLNSLDLSAIGCRHAAEQMESMLDGEEDPAPTIP
jgi:hypothetical protein